MGKLRLARTEEADKVLNDLRILADRMKAAGTRYGLDPPPVNFTLKSDQQVLDDVVYAGLPRHYRHWRYGKQAMQGRSGHIFEFALNSDPSEIALGSTNDLVMQLLVMVHAWLGHAWLDGANAWFRETEPCSVIQKFAQEERFVDSVIAKWGPERYEWFMDAAQALEMHSGWLPTNHEMMPDPEHRRMLENSLTDLEAAYHKAETDFDRQAVEDEIKDTLRMLKCHPIVPTEDILRFLADEEVCPQLPWEAVKLMEIVRWEQRYHQAFMRTRYMHEGLSHWVDSRIPLEPEIDLVALGFDKLIDMAWYGTMHDSYPIYWYSDVYAFGLHLWEYIDKKYSHKTGRQTVKFRRLKLGDDRHIIETDEWVEKVVDTWDRSYMLEVARTFNDRRFFETFINEESMAVLNNKALEWVRRQMQQINKLLADRGWDAQLIFDPLPDTLEDMHYAISVWYNQRLTSLSMGRAWLGCPLFPAHERMLEQMIQIIETVGEWDADKDEYKRQMVLHTDLSFMPNIRLVDTGRFSKTGMHTLRHEYDPDFGPLAQNDARETLRRYWRFAGPCQLLTWELLTDDFGRPVGPPRPYRYFTENGSTVKEQWL